MKIKEVNPLQNRDAYKHHHLPTWFKIMLKKWAKKRNLPYVSHNPSNSLPDLFDHWGSMKVKAEKERVVISCPYGDYMKDAYYFAEELGVRLELSKHSHYHDNAMTVIFKAPY